MQPIKKLSIVLAFLLVALPAIAQSVTHLDQPVRRHISLELRASPTTVCSNGRAFVERFPAGDIASDEFRVPGGDLLVITDFSWAVEDEPTSFSASRILEVSLLSLFPGQSFRTAYWGPPLNLNPDLANLDRIGGGDHIDAGVRVGTGRFLCATATSRSRLTGALHTVVRAELHGYLINKN